MTIFVAEGTPPDSGLDGTLGVCVSPNKTPWQEISVLHALNKDKFKVPVVYIQFIFRYDEETNLYDGSVVFANQNSDYDAFTFGG